MTDLATKSEQPSNSDSGPNGIPDAVLVPFIQDLMSEERRYGFDLQGQISDRRKAVRELVIRYAKRIESP